MHVHFQADDERHSWQTSEDTCKSEGGHLASVYSEAENEALYYYAKQQHNEFPLWLGLKKVFNIYLPTKCNWTHFIVLLE